MASSIGSLVIWAIYGVCLCFLAGLYACFVSFLFPFFSFLGYGASAYELVLRDPGIMTAFVGPDGGSVHIEKWSFLFFTLWALSIQFMLGGYPMSI